MSRCVSLVISLPSCHARKSNNEVDIVRGQKCVYRKLRQQTTISIMHFSIDAVTVMQVMSHESHRADNRTAPMSTATDCVVVVVVVVVVVGVAFFCYSAR